jgi:hypothetical protein
MEFIWDLFGKTHFYYKNKAVKISLRVCFTNIPLGQKLFHKNISKPNRPLPSNPTGSTPKTSIQPWVEP